MNHVKRKTLLIGLLVALPVFGAEGAQPNIEPLARFLNIRVGDIIMIVAVFCSPLFALWAQWRLQLRRERRDQRMRMFKTLMATRATALDINHVQSLNMIDVEFSKSDPTDTAIRDAWKTYHAHLNAPRPQEEMPGRQWDDNQRDYLAQLLSKMGKSLGYNFDFTYYKSGAYHPSGLGDNWNEMEQIRKRWLAVLNGEPLHMAITSIPQVQPQQEQPPKLPARR